MHADEPSRRLPAWTPWLALAGAAFAMMLLSTRWALLPGWLAAALLLLFVRSQRPWVGFAGGVLASTAAVGLANTQIFPGPLAGAFAMAFAGAIANALVYLADRVLVGPRASFAGTLFLPAAATGMELLGSFGSPFGTWGSLAYTQSSALVLVQFVSVAGLSGLTFVMVWFASVANWALEHGFERRRILPGVAAYAGVLAAVLGYGTLRLALAGDGARRVRIAGITVAGEVAAGRNQGFGRIMKGETFDAAALRAFAESTRGLSEELFRLSEREAARGAEVILWSEGNAVVLADELDTFLARGGALAKQHGVWLGMAVVGLTPSAERPLRNELVLVGPDGAVAWRYVKARPVPGPEADLSIAGDGQIPVVEAAGVGRIGGAVCFDADFPSLFAGATAKGLELLLLPSGDWKAIDPLHTRMAMFRAVEQGFSIVRQVDQGRSAAVDAYGRVHGEIDHFETEDRVLRAKLPVSRVPTLYARIGDAVGLLSGLAAIVWGGGALARGVSRKVRARKAPFPQPGA